MFGFVISFFFEHMTWSDFVLFFLLFFGGSLYPRDCLASIYVCQKNIDLAHMTLDTENGGIIHIFPHVGYCVRHSSYEL